MQRRMKKLFTIFAFFALLGCDGTEGPLLDFAPLTAGGQGGASLADPEGEHRAQLRERSSFQIQLSEGVDLDVTAELFVIDANSPDAATFDALFERGSYVACYFSAGSLEPWRPDFEAFPPSVIGDPLPDFPDEHWLDISDPTVVALMEDRIEDARERGCTGVYPAIPRPAGDSNFELGDAEFSIFAQRLAEAAHDLGLGALYAAGPEFTDSASFYDATLVFGCGAAGSCSSWQPYAQAGHGVFQVEYGEEAAPASACTAGFAWPQIVKTPSLDAFRHVCR